jgi:predicted DNA-binding transcriptional regulator AlpA
LKVAPDAASLQTSVTGRVLTNMPTEISVPIGEPARADPVAGDLLTLGATCAFFGGDRPLNPSTLYRGIKAKRYPPPVRVGPNSSRWLRSECHAARLKLIEARDRDAGTLE